MFETKKIVCLANSRKPGGRCIAGKEVKNGDFGNWIRPVSDRSSEEVSKRECQYENGNEPDLLDIIDIPILKHQPHEYQKENWLLNRFSNWSKVGEVKSNDLWKFVDQVDSLWVNESSSQEGLNDRISEDNCKAINDSLLFICVDNLKLKVSGPTERHGKTAKRVQGKFQYGHTKYMLSVTDPKYENKYSAKHNDDYDLGKCFLTVSLGLPYKNYAYKLIAAIIERK